MNLRIHRLTSLLGFALFLGACGKKPPENPPAEPEVRAAPEPRPKPSIEVVLSEPGPAPVEEKSNLIYSAGDTFQGMWNYDRRNFNLRLNIVEVDPESRTIRVTMQSDDLDNAEKEFVGTVLADGRGMELKGIAESGAEYEPVSGYHILNLLGKGKSQTVSLTEFNGRKLRGTAGEEAHIYFWTKANQ